MDHRLVAWARGVKARRRGRGLPVLWLFTDDIRLADPVPAIARLPRRLCGVVFRHDGAPGRAVLAGLVARLCRRLGMPLAIAGDVRLAVSLGVGVHLRDGRWAGVRRRVRGPVTSSAHDGAAVRRASAAGAGAVFLSPAFPTRSHPGAVALGAVRWAGLATRSDAAVWALGGIDGGSVRRLPRWCAGAGAIGALAAPGGVVAHAPQCFAIAMGYPR